jgi:MoaA/NifB/PqqE/SkfB family radical SAM enzyme
MSPTRNITPDVVEKMKAAGVKMISLSIDGSTSEVHDAFRSGWRLRMFQTAIDCARQGTCFRINTTVTQHNLHDLRNFTSSDRSRRRRMGCLHACTHSRGKITMEITPQRLKKLCTKYTTSTPLAHPDQDDLRTPLTRVSPNNRN